MHEGKDISFAPAPEEPSFAVLARKLTKKSISPYAAAPCDLAWQDLTFNVPAPRPPRMRRRAAAAADPAAPPPPTERTVLHPMSGAVRSGQMLAVMGSSGAGKTSLLNVLAGRVATSRGASASGAVYVNGRPRDYTRFRQMSAYVLQDDDMFAELTVREQIAYAATLRLPATMPIATKMARVDRVIQELGLAKVRGSRIGNELERGISGGERKRVSIATELVTDPSLLFLDEPTTGLDSFNALNVVQTLRHLASSGRTVVCTIHQPRSSIFSLFDQLLLLSEGRVMYHGPARDAVAYFASLSFRMPRHFNPADFFLDLLSVDARSMHKEQTTRARVNFIGDRYDALVPQIELPQANGEFDDAELAKLALVEDNMYHQQRRFQNSWGKELLVLTGRSVRLAMRQRMSNKVRFFQVIFFSVLLGLLWLNNGQEKDAKSRLSIAGILFFIVINQSFGGVFAVIFQFPLERSVVTRERATNMYRTSSYFLSKTLTDMPKTFIFNFLFSLVVYWMAGLRREGGAFFQFVLTLFLISTFTESLAVAVSVLTGNPQAAASLIPMLVILCILFGGFFIESGRLPLWIAWFKYASFIFYGYTAMTNVEFPVNTAIAVEKSIRQQSGFSDLNYWVCIGALVGLTVGIKIVGYLFLRYLRGPKFLRF